MFGQVVTLKVYTHWNDDSKAEVRRFKVDKFIVNSFQRLNEKLQEMFPGLKTKTYSVTWKDEEGDDITISSDEEVDSALSSLMVNGCVIKLNVFVNGREEYEDDSDVLLTAVHDHPTVGPPNLLHRGVICDGCNSTVVGFRYKCTSCEDFDLCSRCEANNIHLEHCMVRIPSPVMPHDMIRTAIKNYRHFLKKRSIRNSCLESFATTVLKNLADLAREIDLNSGKTGKTVKSNFGAGDNSTVINIEKETGFRFGFQDKKDNEKFNQTIVPGPSQMTGPTGVFPSFAKRTHNIIKPQRSNFGLLVQPHQYFGERNNLPPAWNRVPNTGISHLCVEGPLKNMGLFGSSNGSNVFGGTNGSNVFGSSQQPSVGLFSASASAPPVVEVAKPEPAPVVENEPTAVSQAEPTSQETPHHPNPLINEALIKMLGMGFSNEGGWLTRLLESEDGNIEAVLEYLPPPPATQPTQPI